MRSPNYSEKSTEQLLEILGLYRYLDKQPPVDLIVELTARGIMVD